MVPSCSKKVPTMVPSWLRQKGYWLHHSAPKPREARRPKWRPALSLRDRNYWRATV